MYTAPQDHRRRARGLGFRMFVDMSFLEVEPEHIARFENVYGEIVRRAAEAEGCISSDLVRLSEINRYCWVERWVSRDAHQQFNEFLFGDIIPGLPEDLMAYVRRLEHRDAEGVVVDNP